MPFRTSRFPAPVLAILALAAVAPAASQAPFGLVEEEPPAEAPADAGAPSGPWHEAASDHFVLRGDVAPAALEEGAADLERLRRVVSELARGGAVVSDRPTYVYLFSSDAAFAPYRPPGSSDADAGYVLPGEEASYAATASGEVTRQVFRQYVHQLLHRELPDLPLWLRAGLAEYYSTFEADAEEARIGLPDETRLQWSGLTGEKGLPLATMLALDAAPETGDPVADSLFETRSWLLTHYLMSGDTAHRRRIGDYVRRTAAGEDPVAAFRAAFGVEDFEAFEETLEEYRRGESFVFLRVPLAGGSGAAPEISARPLPEAEAALAQGELLLRLGPSRRDAAEARRRRAVALDDTLGPAWAGLAGIAAARGDATEALELYRRAAELAPDDFGVQLGLGQALLDALGGRRASDPASRQTVASAAAAFRRATELRPDSGEAWAGLGQAGVLAAEPDPAAVPALERAVERLPAERTDVLFNLLLARARTGDGDGVDEATLALREAGAGEDLLARAREVRLQLTLQEAHALATAGKLDDAVALFAVVRAEATNPALAEQAATLLERVSRAEEHNRFAASSTEAVELFRAGDLEAAAARVEEMMRSATPGRQMDTLRQLRARIALEGQEP